MYRGREVDANDNDLADVRSLHRGRRLIICGHVLNTSLGEIERRHEGRGQQTPPKGRVYKLGATCGLAYSESLKRQLECSILC
jgi:hypothetical protein